MTADTTTEISIADDFSRFPAGRYPEDGEFNGTLFREEYLVPTLKKLRGSDQLLVTFDGVAGFGSSFLEEAFGGLVRCEHMTKAFLDTHLKISVKEDHDLEDFVQLTLKYIVDAAQPHQ